MKQRECCVKYEKQTRRTQILSKFTILDRAFRHSTRRQNPRSVGQTHAIKDTELRIQGEQGGGNVKESRTESNLRREFWRSAEGSSRMFSRAVINTCVRENYLAQEKSHLKGLRKQYPILTQSKKYCLSYTPNYQPYNP